MYGVELIVVIQLLVSGLWLGLGLGYGVLVRVGVGVGVGIEGLGWLGFGLWLRFLVWR